MVMTRVVLAQYTYLQSEIKRIKRRLKYYNENPLTGSMGVVKGSMTGFPYTECHFVVGPATVKSDEQRENTIQQLIIDLKGNEQLYKDIKLDIELFLESAPELKEDLELKNIMYMKYVEGKKDGEIAKNFNYDRRTIGKKIDRFLDKYESANSKEVSHISHL